MVRFLKLYIQACYILFVQFFPFYYLDIITFYHFAYFHIHVYESIYFTIYACFLVSAFATEHVHKYANFVLVYLKSPKNCTFHRFAA